jgi:hypothetical protein
MTYFASHLNHSEKRMALEVINSIEHIIDEWKLDPALFSAGQDAFDAYLEIVVGKFAKVFAPSRLPVVSINQIRRRLYIALTTSLYRFSRDQQKFQLEFGSISATLRAMQVDHTMFCRVMAYFGDQTPYFNHTASQTFWRTLQSLNTEHLSQGAPAYNRGGPIRE